MGKAANKPRRAENEARSVVRALRTSPRKLNLVAQMIRGKNVAQARNELSFCERRIAGAVNKALYSAIQNAEHNHQLDIDKLFVAEASVGRAFVMKRFHARGRGRSAGVQKFFSHLTIVVREREELN